MVALVPGAAEHDRLKQFLGVLYPFDRGLVNAVLEMQRYIGGQKDRDRRWVGAARGKYQGLQGHGELPV